MSLSPITPDEIAAWPGKKIEDIYHPALWHMLDVGAVATKITEHRPLTPRNDWDHAFVLLAALHDLGKISNCFRNMICGREYKPIPHWQLSFRLLKDNDDLVCAKLGGNKTVRQQLYASVAGHHGGPPSNDEHRELRKKREAIGTDATRVAKKTIATMLDLFPNASLDGLSEQKAKGLSWTLSGFTVQADWIGSNSDWFPAYSADIKISTYWRNTLERAQKAIAKAGLHHATPTTDAKVLQPEKTLRPMQKAVLDICIDEGPTMVLIEDATGSGKTEAALMLASRMMALDKGSGIFFALPTMATSNAMLDRLEKIVPKLFEGRPSLALTHGQSKQNTLFRKLIGKDGSDPNEPVTCGQWLADDRRRVLLADVGVGTIDQALMAVLPTRFNALRLWALSKSILIVDEAHGYDPYMEQELCQLLQFQAMLGGSVILMTATLPKKMRDKYSVAFQKGLDVEFSKQITNDAYPLLTSVGQQITEYKPAPAAEVCRSVKILRIDSESAVEILYESAARGATCVWVRNAIDDAISAVQQLRNAGVQSELLHSRFTVADRVSKETSIQEKIGYFGQRPKGYVLVATQVVEASLDLDFDVMISDLAPIGALIQRTGRLWRHMDVRPATVRPVKKPELYVVSPNPAHVKDKHWLSKMLPSGAWVYPLDQQWRTIKVLLETGEICTPGGLHNLIEAVHGEDLIDVPEALRTVESETFGQHMAERQQAQSMLLRPCSYSESAQKVFEEEKLQTRLGEPQITLRLARESQDGLVPLAENWILSEVKVSAKRYSKLDGIDQSDPDIAVVRNKLPKWQRRGIYIAPVKPSGEICSGLRYDNEYGLIITS